MFGRMNKMASWEFFLQDGGLSESLTHKIAAWENCLQDGDNAKPTKRKQRRTPPFCVFHSRDGATVAKWATALQAVANSVHDLILIGLLSSCTGLRLSDN